MSIFKDLTGMKFSKLTVVEYLGKSKWRCKCDCGGEKVARADALKDGTTKHCGCERKEKKNNLINEMIGKKIGRLTIVSLNEEKSNEVKKYGNKNVKRRHYNCVCECGGTKVANENDLKQGKILSCGCLEKEHQHEHCQSQDLKGMKFNKLTCIEYLGDSLWLCQCECGNTCTARTASLHNGNKKSCGCLHIESVSGENNSRYNPNLTEEDRQDRRLQNGYNDWCKQVKEQANFTCDCCGQVGGKLCSHHLNNYRNHPELRTELSNGVCLCEKCHKEFHKWMGSMHSPCTKEDYYKWKEES